MVRLTRPWLGPEEQRAISSVLESGMLVQGEKVAELEGLLAAATQRTHAVATSNGTSALALSLAALEIGPGDKVLCPNLTWPSPAHAILERGAEPVLVDVDAREWNALPEDMAQAAVRAGGVHAAIAIDQFGNPARASAIAAALQGALGRPVPLIVDAACSLGSSIDGRPCGALGVIACTSFHPRKVITTGEGGACMTDDDALAEKLRQLRNHGQSAPGSFARVSGNHRMTELAAAIGVVQMGKLQAIVEERRAIAARYRAAFGALGVGMQEAPDGALGNAQTFGIVLAQGASRAERDRVIAELGARDVQAGALSYALHALPHMSETARKASARGERFDRSEAIVARGLALPLYPGMREEDVRKVIDAVSGVLA